MAHLPAALLASSFPGVGLGRVDMWSGKSLIPRGDYTPLWCIRSWSVQRVREQVGFVTGGMKKGQSLTWPAFKSLLRSSVWLYQCLACTKEMEVVWISQGQISAVQFLSSHKQFHFQHMYLLILSNCICSVFKRWKSIAWSLKTTSPVSLNISWKFLRNCCSPRMKLSSWKHFFHH